MKRFLLSLVLVGCTRSLPPETGHTETYRATDGTLVTQNVSYMSVKQARR